MREPVALSVLSARCGGRHIGDEAWLRGASIDSRQVSAGDLFVAFDGARVDGHDFAADALAAGAAAVMVARELPLAAPQCVVADPQVGLGVLGRMSREGYEGTLIGITGSAGKTSAKNLLAAILGRAGNVVATEGNLNNELGVPLTLLRLGRETEYAVVEMGCGKPGDIRYLASLAKPQIGVVLNAAPAHLEFFGSVAGIAATKGELFDDLGAGDLAVLNGDQDFAADWAARAAPARVLRFGYGPELDYRATDVVSEGFVGSHFRLLGPQGDLALSVRLPGEGGVMNALAAATVALELGISPDTVAAGVASAVPEAGRGRAHTLASGAVVVDDAYNANPLAVAAAVAMLAASPGPHTLVLGDMLELGPDAARFHAAVGEQCRQAGIETLVTVGALAAHAGAGFGAGARHFDSVDALLDALASLPMTGTLLVKASRGARLERVVAALCEQGGGPC